MCCYGQGACRTRLSALQEDHGHARIIYLYIYIYICMHTLISCRWLHIASGQNPVCDLPTLSLAARHACNSGNLWRSQIMIIVSFPQSVFWQARQKRQESRHAASKKSRCGPEVMLKARAEVPNLVLSSCGFWLPANAFNFMILG